jgi:dTDP-4-dehydrorhamnose reductase
MILITGASGLLGRHLKIEADRPTHNELDITKPIEPKSYELIVHCAAWTKVEQAETDRLECFDVNVRGTLNLLNAYSNTPFVYISSEYARNPVNFYSLTKSLAEQLVTYHAAPYLIIRTLFKPYPWPYAYAFKDQHTMGDYVTYIAPKIDKVIQEWDRKSKLIYVGTGRKTMYEMALETKPDVIGNSIKDMKVKLPYDYR